MVEENKENPLFARAEDFLQLFNKGAEFTRELLKENERLRFKLVRLEEMTKKSGTPEAKDVYTEGLEKRIVDLERELEQLIKSYREVEEENKDFANRYVEIELENNNLANLYVASFQLHSTLDFKEVLQVILEIVINLIGAEIFAVLLLDEKDNELSAVVTEGIDREEMPTIKIGEGVIGSVAKSGENYFVEEIVDFEEFNPAEPIACIPLKIKEHVIGVIAIYKLLSQKQKFTELDYELFTLLAGHAATAIFSSKIYSESERKLSTFQGFIELLTK